MDDAASVIRLVAAPKALSDRTHTCERCGTLPVDRDVHAAYLATCVTIVDGHPVLDTGHAHAVRPGVELPLSAVSGTPHGTAHPRPGYRREGGGVRDGRVLIPIERPGAVTAEPGVPRRPRRSSPSV